MVLSESEVVFKILNICGIFVIYLIVLIFIGNAICHRILIKIFPLSESDDDNPSTGDWIGGLERIIISIGMVFNSWQVLAALMALKTVSRFKQLDHKLFAEKFLIGSMFSFVWAFICYLVLKCIPMTSALIYDIQKTVIHITSS